MMLAVVAFATMSAQDEPIEQTIEPSVSDYLHGFSTYEYGDQYYYECYTCTVEVFNYEVSESTIYYRYTFDGGEPTAWMIYTEPIDFLVAGSYCFEAYAQAEDKLPSDIVSVYFDVSRIGYHVYFDFLMDSVLYKKTSDSTVAVAPVTKTTMTEPFWSIVHGYSGQVVIPRMVEYDGITYTVTAVDDFTFSACEVTTVVLPSTITSIGTYAFSCCESLARVTCQALTPPRVSMGTFFGYVDVTSLYERIILFVPNESLEAYRAHEEWGKFSRIVPFIGAGPGDVNGDGNIAISDATSLIDMLLGGDELPAWADVNGDGNVTIADVTVLIDMLLGN